MINKKSNSFTMITHVCMSNNDIYKFFYLDKSPQNQKFLTRSQGTSHTSGDIQPCSSTSPQIMKVTHVQYFMFYRYNNNY